MAHCFLPNLILAKLSENKVRIKATWRLKNNKCYLYVRLFRRLGNRGLSTILQQWILFSSNNWSKL